MTIRNARPRHFDLTFLRPLRRLAWAAAALPLLGGGCSGSAPSETAADAAEAAEGAGACQQVDENTARVASDLPGIAAWTLRTETPRGLFSLDVILTLTGEDAAGAARIAGRFRLHLAPDELSDPNSLATRAGDDDPANDPTPAEVIAFYRERLYEDQLLEDGAPLPPDRYLQAFASLGQAFSGCSAGAAATGPEVAARLTADGGDEKTGGLRQGRERTVGLWVSGTAFFGAIGAAVGGSLGCASLLSTCAATGVTGVGLALCVGAAPACAAAGAAIVGGLSTATAMALSVACEAGVRVPFLEPVRSCTCERELGAGATMYANANRLVCVSCPSGTAFEVAHEALKDRCVCGTIEGETVLPQHIVDEPATGERRAICDGRVCVNSYTFSTGFDGLTFSSSESEATVGLGEGWGALPSNSKIAEYTLCGADRFGTYRGLGSTCEAGDTSSVVEGFYIGQDVVGRSKTFAYTDLSLPKLFDDRSALPGSSPTLHDMRGATVECGGPYWCGDGAVHACSPAERQAAKDSAGKRNPPTAP